MITIRKNTFETNSSSTHCLCFNKNSDSSSVDESILEESMIISPFTYQEVDAYMTLTTLKDKLRYLLTVYVQCDYFGKPFMQMVQELCPNVIFQQTFTPHNYVFEDADYFFQYDEPESDSFKKDTLKQFLLTGTVYFGSRDDCEFMSEISSITHNKEIFSVAWSG